MSRLIDISAMALALTLLSTGVILISGNAKVVVFVAVLVWVFYTVALVDWSSEEQ